MEGVRREVLGRLPGEGAVCSVRGMKPMEGAGPGRALSWTLALHLFAAATLLGKGRQSAGASGERLFVYSKELGSFEGLSVLAVTFLNGFCHAVSQTYFQTFYPALIRLRPQEVLPSTGLTAVNFPPGNRV